MSYQKAVDAATAQVAVAQQALDQATITTPIAGTVVAVTMSVGESVSDATTQTHRRAGCRRSRSDHDGRGRRRRHGEGRTARVRHARRFVEATRRDRERRQCRADLVGLDRLPGRRSHCTTRSVSINNGSTGTVAIVTEQSDTGLAVPTSAVSSIGDRHFVTVDDGGSTRQVAVEVGVVGKEWTSITSGVTAGQEVVLADLDQALPSSATESSGNDTGDVKLPGGGGGGPTFRIGGPAN